MPPNHRYIEISVEPVKKYIGSENHSLLTDQGNTHIQQGRPPYHRDRNKKKQTIIYSTHTHALLPYCTILFPLTNTQNLVGPNPLSALLTTDIYRLEISTIWIVYSYFIHRHVINFKVLSEYRISIMKDSLAIF